MASRARVTGRRLSPFSAILAAAIPIAGCSDLGAFSDTDAGQLGGLLFHQIAGIGTSEGVPRARAAAIPYASLGVRLGSSDESMFVLASKTGYDLHWVGGKKLAITTRNGRIVQTAGFAHNLTGYQSLAPGLVGGKPSDSAAYVFDYGERSQYGIAIKCTTRDIGPERIEILGVPHDTRHVAEDCQAPLLDWAYTNEFWSDRSGMVWKSVQYVEPNLDHFELEVLRPAS